MTNAGLGDLIFESLSTNSDQFEVLDPEHTHREALSLDGSGDYLYGSSSSIGLPYGNGSFTAEAWIKPDNMDGTQVILSWGRYDYSNQANRLELVDTQLRHSFHNNDLSVDVGDFTDTWHHVAVSYESGDTRKLYLDGVMIASDNPGSVNVHNSYNFYIGCKYNNYDYYHGSIDEVRISNYAIYDSGFTPQVEFNTTAQTEGLWHFDGNYQAV